MKKEISALYRFFSQYGSIVDLNLDYYKTFIVVTFSKHSDVLKILKLENLKYIGPNNDIEQKEKRWDFKPSKIDFVLPVRNFNSTQKIEEKFLPIELKQTI